MEESGQTATMEEQAAHQEAVSRDSNCMNPVLWGTLPRELLLLVLARLPVREMSRLRCQLSKDWTMSHNFNRVCDDANPKMGAQITHVGRASEFSVRIFDYSKCAWLYMYRFHLRHQGHSLGRRNVWKPMASDGGLFCFVSAWKYTEAHPMCLVVFNPLTRVQHKLPPLHYVHNIPPMLVSMKVDSETKEYKIVVVGKLKGRHSVETYDSGCGQWSSGPPPWGRIFGHAQDWGILGSKCFRLRRSTRCAYDLEGRVVEPLVDFELLFHCDGARVRNYALANDRMFVLYEKLSSTAHFVTEFQSRNSADLWVPVKTHGECTPAAYDYTNFDIHACEDFLMVRRFVDNADDEVHWTFVDLSTSEWRDLPGISPHFYRVSLTSRVSWNVDP